jgi:hypothetical protein
MKLAFASAAPSLQYHSGLRFSHFLGESFERSKPFYRPLQCIDELSGRVSVTNAKYFGGSQFWREPTGVLRFPSRCESGLRALNDIDSMAWDCPWLL